MEGTGGRGRHALARRRVEGTGVQNSKLCSLKLCACMLFVYCYYWMKTIFDMQIHFSWISPTFKVDRVTQYGRLIS